MGVQISVLFRETFTANTRIPSNGLTMMIFKCHLMELRSLEIVCSRVGLGVQRCHQVQRLFPQLCHLQGHHRVSRWQLKLQASGSHITHREWKEGGLKAEESFLLMLLSVLSGEKDPPRSSPVNFPHLRNGSYMQIQNCLPVLIKIMNFSYWWIIHVWKI